MKLGISGGAMGRNTNLLVLCVLMGVGAIQPASAQQIYKCVSGRSVTYSERPCSTTRIERTLPAAAPVKPVDLRRQEHGRAMAMAMRPMPGETAAQFETRKRRARLPAEDSAECARLEARMPVETAAMDNPDPAEVMAAETALRESTRRYGELRC
jgi:hypothetical protein